MPPKRPYKSGAQKDLLKEITLQKAQIAMLRAFHAATLTSIRSARLELEKRPVTLHEAMRALELLSTIELASKTFLDDLVSRFGPTKPPRKSRASKP